MWKILLWMTSLILNYRQKIKESEPWKACNSDFESFIMKNVADLYVQIYIFFEGCPFWIMERERQNCDFQNMIRDCTYKLFIVDKLPSCLFVQLSSQLIGCCPVANYQLYNIKSQYLEIDWKSVHSGFHSAVMGYATDLNVQKIRTYCQPLIVHGYGIQAIFMNFDVG